MPNFIAFPMNHNGGENRIYDLVMRQEPKQARMCGVGGKADRRPIDPPPIVQLRVIDPAASERRRTQDGSPAPSSSSTLHDDEMDNGYAQSFLQNPYYFMFASLAKPDDDTELHWLKDGRTRCTTGSVVSSLYHLKDPQNNNEDAGFFVFPDLSVRTEGSYRLKLSLFEVVGNNVRHCKSIFSAPFYVYTAKKFPGMEESTPLSCSLADQGIKIRIRKDIRVRKRPNQPYDLTMPLPMDDQDDEEEDNQLMRRDPKRSRTDDGLDSQGARAGAPSTALVPLSQQPQQPQQQSWPPPTGQDPALGPSIPPPPNATVNNSLSVDGAPGTGMMSMAPSVPPPGPGVYNPPPAPYPTYDQSAPPMQQGQPQQQYPAQGAPQQQHPQHPHGPPPPPPMQHQGQQVYGQPPIQHMAPQGHVHPAPPPPPPGHMVPPHPPPPQGYAPYPQAWGAPPPPQQPVYDGYYHPQQHAPPGVHPHYAAHPNAYAQPPPPAHVTPRYDYYPQQPPPPMPAQYGYYDQSGQMHHQQMPPQQQQPQPAPQYAVPPPPQGVPPHQAPHPHPQYAPPPAAVGAAPPQQAGPGQAPPPPAATGSPNTAPPPIAQQSQQNQQQQPQQQQQQQQQPHQQPMPSGNLNYDYSSYRPPTGSPQPGAGPYAPPPPHPQQPHHQQGHPPPPPAPYAPYAGHPPHMQQRMNPYAPPPPAPYYYGTPQPPPTTPNDWSNAGYVQQPPPSAWPDYSQQQQQQPQPHHAQPPMQPQPHHPQPQPHLQQPTALQPQSTLQSTPSSSSSSSLMGATGGDRIQLAPLRSSSEHSSNGGPPSTTGSSASPLLPLSSPVANAPGSYTSQNGYSPVRSSSRSGYGPGASVTPPSRERDDRSGGGREGSGERDNGKKNPLRSIESIISDNHSR
ncbi:velvet factor-domain-containing protein [Coprinopsis sp. MPI-PUGE-AT-0042]|nr:velvet factor-domain-containing protein [Coprinopsis sp. MPI-PUGE-AT-0042]